MLQVDSICDFHWNLLLAITIQTLRTFVLVAECGGLAEAARRLHRTPSALSMTLKALEAQLGQPLFEADRKNRLTPLGDVVFASARRQVQGFDAAVRDMLRHARGEAGRVAVACVPSVATRLLPEVLRRFRVSYPGVLVDVRDMDSVSVHEMLRAGGVDIGIASPLEGAGASGARLLARDEFGVVCAAGHALSRRRRPIRWDDIDTAEFIANGTCERIDDAGMRRLIAGCSLTVRNTTSLLALVVAGVGVTVLPRLAVDTGNPGLAFRALAPPVPVRELMLLYEDGSTPSAAVAAFTTVLEEIAAGFGQANAATPLGAS